MTTTDPHLTIIISNGRGFTYRYGLIISGYRSEKGIVVVSLFDEVPSEVPFDVDLEERPVSFSLIEVAGLGALGFVLVVLATRDGASGSVPIALAILVIAALSGFYLASLQLRKQVAPRPVVLVHAGAAVVGFLLLGKAVFGLL